MKIFNFIFLTFLLLQGCGRNYEKELEETVKECQLKGAKIQAVSDLRHFVIYEYDDSFWIDNLDEPAKKILYPKQEITFVSRNLYFDSNGKPYIQKDFEKESFGAYILTSLPEAIELFKGDGAFTFSHTIDYCDPFERGTDNKSEQCSFSYYLNKPDSIFITHVSPLIDYKKDYARTYMLYLDRALNGDSQYSIYNSGYFTWGFALDEQGEVKKMDDSLEYILEEYNEETDNYDFVSNIYMNYEDFFLSKEKAKIALEKVFNMIDNNNEVNRKKWEVRRKKRLIEESITLEQLSHIFANPIKAKKDYVGKYITIKCNLEAIKEANGMFDLDGYKYKIRCFAFDAFGEWISGHDLIGYTNDENFVNLSYPENVVIYAKLISGTRRKFEFKDCELLAW